jgi:N utilization substance protein B
MLLYEAEAKTVTPSALLDDLPVVPDDYTCAVVRGVEANSSEVDELISRHAIGWALDRMPAVDRAVLRVATYELLERLDVPTAVILSEAVELAGEYSTDESGRFVNGVLASVATALRGS